MNTQQLSYNTAMLLVSHEDMAVADRHVFKQATLRIKHTFTSGFEAVKYLDTVHSQGTPLPECIFCDEQLNDMLGQDFINLMRLHPAFITYPIIIIISKKEKRPVGCSGILIRPYNLDDLCTQLTLAKQCQAITEKALKNTPTRTHDAFNAEFIKLEDKQASSTQEAKDLYREALFAFKMQQYDKAIMLLQRCLKINEYNSLAQQALATILEHKIKQKKQLKTIKIQHAKTQTPKRPSTATIQLSNKPKNINKTVEQAERVTIPELEALSVEETIVLHANDNPIVMNLDSMDQGENQTISLIKEPSGSKLLARFPRLHEIFVIARTTISLIRRS